MIQAVRIRRADTDEVVAERTEPPFTPIEWPEALAEAPDYYVEVVDYAGRAFATPPQEFVAMRLVFDTTGRPSPTVMIPLSGNTSLVVSWGDGAIERTGATPAHTYEEHGVYSVNVVGRAQHLGFPNFLIDKRWTETVIAIDDLGSLGLTNLSWAWSQVGRDSGRDEIGMPRTLPASVTNLRTAWNGIHVVNLDLSGWDASNVVDLGYAWELSRRLTSLDLSSFIVKNVTTLIGAWQNCWELASLDLSNWDVRKVTNLSSAWAGCSMLVNLSLSAWQTNSLTTLDRAFWGCPLLSGESLVQIASWNVSKLTAGNQRVTNTANLTPEQYDAILLAWGAQDVQPGVTMQMTPAKYTAAGKPGRDALIGKGWTIVDGGMVE